jgi:hypothetical protein
MTRIVRIQTSFAAGALDPLLAGRIDLRARAEGAHALRNVLPLATGGLVRRPGMRFLAEAADARRLVAFETARSRALIALAPGRLDVFEAPGSGLPPVSFSLPAAWNAVVLAGLVWTTVGERLLFCHPDVEPRILERRSDGSWQFGPWQPELVDASDPTGPTRLPQLKFASESAELQILVQGAPTAQPIAAGTAVELLVTEPLFTAAHPGTWMRIRNGYALITSVGPSATRAQAILRQGQPNSGPTRDFAEPAFSPARGWPRSAAWYQNRLVLGGSRDAPDRVWMSKSGAPFNFDVGTGLDDEAIDFRLTADVPHTIRRLWPGRRLAIFTDRGEWVVHGRPVTPATVAVELQTRIGSPSARTPRIAEIDGAMLFVGASGRDVREFIYVDSEQAWQAADVALLARHLVRDVVDLIFDNHRRQLLLLRADGTLATCTIDRNANIVAWAEHDTAGFVQAIEGGADATWFLVVRNGRTQIEVWDEGVLLDGVRRSTSPLPTSTWSGLSAFVGSRVGIIADNRFLGFFQLAAPTIALAEPASELLVGHPYAHIIEPDTAPTAGGMAPDAPHRPVRVSLRLHATEALQIDVGLGLQEVPLPEVPFTGDIELRALGWRRGPAEPAWRVEQNLPLPFTLLSATTDTRVNG